VTWQSYENEFTAAAVHAGHSFEFIAASLTYARQLWARELPIVYDDAHLAALLGFELLPLHRALGRPRSLYRTTYIPKHSGGHRRIDAPIASLKTCQLWVLRNLLERVPVHPAANAFQLGRSIRANAAAHIGSPIIISLDVKDFFSSLSADRCEALFLNLGYRADVAKMLRDITTFENSLPQGAPSSPAMSNLLMRDFDAAVSEFTDSANLRYTRYAGRHHCFWPLPAGNCHGSLRETFDEGRLSPQREQDTGYVASPAPRGYRSHRQCAPAGAARAASVP